MEGELESDRSRKKLERNATAVGRDYGLELGKSMTKRQDEGSHADIDNHFTKKGTSIKKDAHMLPCDDFMLLDHSTKRYDVTNY